MLIITRRNGEGIEIGGGIVVRVMDIRRGQVRIGVQAPADVRISRVDEPRPMQQQCLSLAEIPPMHAHGG